MTSVDCLLLLLSLSQAPDQCLCSRKFACRELCVHEGSSQFWNSCGKLQHSEGPRAAHGLTISALLVASSSTTHTPRKAASHRSRAVLGLLFTLVVPPILHHKFFSNSFAVSSRCCAVPVHVDACSALPAESQHLPLSVCASIMFCPCFPPCDFFCQSYFLNLVFTVWPGGARESNCDVLPLDRSGQSRASLLHPPVGL